MTVYITSSGAPDAPSRLGRRRRLGEERHLKLETDAGITGLGRCRALAVFTGTIGAMSPPSTSTSAAADRRRSVSNRGMMADADMPWSVIPRPRPHGNGAVRHRGQASGLRVAELLGGRCPRRAFRFPFSVADPDVDRDMDDGQSALWRGLRLFKMKTASQPRRRPQAHGALSARSCRPTPIAHRLQPGLVTHAPSASCATSRPFKPTFIERRCRGHHTCRAGRDHPARSNNAHSRDESVFTPTDARRSPPPHRRPGLDQDHEHGGCWPGARSRRSRGRGHRLLGGDTCSRRASPSSRTHVIAATPPYRAGSSSTRPSTSSSATCWPSPFPIEKAGDRAENARARRQGRRGQGQHLRGRDAEIRQLAR